MRATTEIVTKATTKMRMIVPTITLSAVVRLHSVVLLVGSAESEGGTSHSATLRDGPEQLVTTGKQWMVS